MTFAEGSALLSGVTGSGIGKRDEVTFSLDTLAVWLLRLGLQFRTSFVQRTAPPTYAAVAKFEDPQVCGNSRTIEIVPAAAA
jgi:hypothetical protein